MREWSDTSRRQQRVGNGRQRCWLPGAGGAQFELLIRCRVAAATCGNELAWGRNAPRRARCATWCVRRALEAAGARVGSYGE